MKREFKIKNIGIAVVISFFVFYIVGGIWFASENIKMERQAVVCKNTSNQLKNELKKANITISDSKLTDSTILVGGNNTPNCNMRTPLWSLQGIQKVTMYILFWVPMIIGKSV